MGLQVTELSLELIEVLRPLVSRIKQRNRGLADQIVRAASSIALNLGEAEHSDPGNRRARFFSASGSASETLVALRVVAGWHYARAEDVAAASALLRRIIAILWRLTH